MMTTTIPFGCSAFLLYTIPSNLPRLYQGHQKHHYYTQSSGGNTIFWALFASSFNTNGNSKNNNNGNNNSNKPKNNKLSNSEWERREEDRRRQQRKDDVVIGQTSKRNVHDYPLDVRSTEQEYSRQASQMEQQIYHYTKQGMEALNNLQLEQANTAFQKVFDLNPAAYLWQAGIVHYYLNN
ncbi:hypothetical protein IV203_037007 [Nitzschia inconspicua]|uniref:Uncharacterized protein n=1 Tax=Nitzschia inconspicua TaxID=303405 RepID=A0A9K3K5L9_9STRA|nr:hypothetical protein IV203_037007 [Nitzschia inconspicua]